MSLRSPSCPQLISHSNKHEPKANRAPRMQKERVSAKHDYSTSLFGQTTLYVACYNTASTKNKTADHIALLTHRLLRRRLALRTIHRLEIPSTSTLHNMCDQGKGTLLLHATPVGAQIRIIFLCRRKSSKQLPELTEAMSTAPAQVGQPETSPRLCNFAFAKNSCDATRATTSTNHKETTNCLVCKQFGVLAKTIYFCCRNLDSTKQRFLPRGA